MGFGDCKDSVVLYDARNRQWLFFHRPLQVHVANSLESVVSTLRAVEHQVTIDHLHAAGFIAYEAGPAFDPALAVRSPGAFPLLWFGIYREPEKISFPPLAQESPANIFWEPSVSEKEYRLSLSKIKAYIQAGDTYQVNYTFRLRAPFFEDPWRLFVQMIHAQGYGYAAFVNTERWTICSASPELFFTLEAEELISRPMKGTASRGLMQAEDLERAAWLQHSEKNRAENVMIVDMVRNDMGRIADVGSVEVPSLFDVEKYPTLWQMTSTVRCRTKASITDIFRAFFPAASITGAPKVRTMQIISELENAPRRIYTGTVGFVSPGRKAQFNVAIRTVLVDRLSHTSEYGVGGGIVWDSEKADELQECYTKARILVQPTPSFALLETILWIPQEGYFLLDGHLNRLRDSSAYFSRPVDIEAIREKLNDLARELPPRPHRIRLVVPQENEPTLEAHILSPPLQPYRIRLAKTPIHSRDPFLYHKTTHRHVYERALAESPGYDDVLLWNEREEVTESCIANVLVEVDGRLLTPPVHCGLLSGTYRSLLLKQDKVREEMIHVQDLSRCSKIYLVNSVRGIWEASLELKRTETVEQNEAGQSASADG
jgi:para-aminobenzoate synthetase/4-amino-4-deoxychorismate lyase